MKYIFTLSLIILLIHDCACQFHMAIGCFTNYNNEYNKSYNYLEFQDSLNKKSFDSLKFEMFKKSCRTIYNDHRIGFVVIIVLDKNNGIQKEICLNVLNLTSALRREYNIPYDNSGDYFLDSIFLNNNTRYFEFSNQNALDKINFNLYTFDELSEFKNSLNIDSIKSEVYSNPLLNHNLRESHKDWMFNYSNEVSPNFLDKKQMTMLAHLLFNNGILTYYNGGLLYYFDF